ncbi:MAG: lytic transglycosylase domain-containing protein [Roseburia sp.]
MNVTVLQYLDQAYVNSLYEAQKQQETSTPVSTENDTTTDFATTLADAVNTVSSVQNTASAQDTTSTQSTTSAIEYTNDTLEAIFQKASDTYGVSVNLLKAIAKAESGFNQYATSHAGAMGIMQLMPATAASLGVTDAYDAEQNIMGGANLISQLLTKYNGDVSLALAAYNAGSGNVEKYGGIPPFTETQNYVSKILGYLGGEVTVSVPTTSAVSSMSAKEKEVVNTALEVIFSKLDINKNSLDAMVDVIQAVKGNS